MGNRIFGFVVGAFWFAAALAEPISIHFDQIPVKDFAKVVFGDVVKIGYVVHESADQAKISVYFPSSQPAQIRLLAVDALKASGLSVEYLGGVVVIGKRVEPEVETIIYRPKYRAVSYLSELLQAAVPSVVTGARRAAPNIDRAAGSGGQGVGQGDRLGVAPISGEVGSSAVFDKGVADVLIARVETGKAEVVRKILEQLDIASAEVVVRAVAYEVQKSARQGSALDLVLSVLKGKVGVELKGALAGADSSISFKFGGFDAIVSALDSDTRFKAVSRPSVRVKSGSLARFAVGSDVPVLGAVVTQGQGSAVQSVDYRSSGVLLDVTPQVREGRIDLKLRQEFSAFVQTSTGVQNSPTLNKRSAETELTVSSGEVVFIGGLESDETTASSQSGLFGVVFGKADEQRHNELVLMVEATRI